MLVGGEATQSGGGGGASEAGQPENCAQTDDAAAGAAAAGAAAAPAGHTTASASASTTHTPQTAKPYFTKRPHKKSRGGCRSCKTRKVKCDEARPRCRACTLRNETCTYSSSSHSPGVAPGGAYGQGGGLPPSVATTTTTMATASLRHTAAGRSTAAARDAVRRQRVAELALGSAPSTGIHIASAILPDVSWQSPPSRADAASLSSSSSSSTLSASSSQSSSSASPPAASAPVSHTYSALVRRRGRRQSIDSQTPLQQEAAQLQPAAAAAAATATATATATANHHRTRARAVPATAAFSSSASSASDPSLVVALSSGQICFPADDDLFALNTTLFPLCHQPLYMPAQVDETDMKLLWFFTTKGYDAFAPDAGRDPKINEILQVTIPHHAFASRFLMDCLLGLAAVEMAQLHRLHSGSHAPSPRHDFAAVDKARMYKYRARAYSGYRAAIQAARPETFPALLACSLLLCALSSQTFREEAPSAEGPGGARHHPLYILDWMIVWRGIGIIVELIRPQTLFASGMAMLFARPPINLDAAARHVPNPLLFMVSAIPADDADAAESAVYYETLKYLGSLYREMAAGFGRVLNLRIITWFTFLPKAFVELARARRPRALVILAHYLAFTKLCQRVWWMAGIADKEIRDIDAALGPAWRPLLRVPLACLAAETELDLARLLLANDRWTPDSRYDQHRDRPANKEFVLVDDEGHPVEIDGEWFCQAETGSPAVWHIHDSRRLAPTTAAATTTTTTTTSTTTTTTTPDAQAKASSQSAAQDDGLFAMTVLINDDDGSGEKVELRVPICSQLPVRRSPSRDRVL